MEFFFAEYSFYDFSNKTKQSLKEDETNIHLKHMQTNKDLRLSYILLLFQYIMMNRSYYRISPQSISGTISNS